jgi:hypothetical protein
MARPIPKAILSQASDSLRITGHFADVLRDSMFDGAKKCPEMNSDSRLWIISLLFLEGTAGCRGPWITMILVKKSRSREFSREFFTKIVKIFKFCPKFGDLALDAGN